MHRREFIGNTAKAAFGLAALKGKTAAASSKKPNIVIIMCDDLGYGDVGCYGSGLISTPNIDRLAKEGVRLTSFFSCSPLCTPSRAGLMTGRYPARTGLNSVITNSMLLPVTGLGHLYHQTPAGLPLREITMADLLSKQGYRTGCIGKWHLGDLKKHQPRNRGFDHYFGLLTSNDHPYIPLFRNEQIVEKHPVDQDYLTQKYTREAVGFIEQNRDNPFFLYFAHTFPHQPLHASPQFRGRSSAGLYGDCVEEIDWSVGQVMDALAKNGLDENTFVFFTSDNGPWYEGNPGNFRGRKSETFDGGMRVPAIARRPGVIPEGLVSDEMAMNFDLFTTALEMAGGTVPADRAIDGKNILPMLRGQAESPHQALFFYSCDELFSTKKGRVEAVRSGNWKYHRRHQGWAQPFYKTKRGPAIFDIQQDPQESYNLIHSHQELASQMEGMIREHEKGVGKR